MQKIICADLLFFCVISECFHDGVVAGMVVICAAEPYVDELCDAVFQLCADREARFEARPGAKNEYCLRL